MSAQVETMMNVREKPWHGLGVVVDHDVKIDEAIQLSGLGWNVSKEKVFTEVSGKKIEVPGTFATVRDTDHHILGVVGDRYQVVQNKDAFQFVEKMRLDGDVNYETAGSLYGGSTVFLTAKMGQFKLLGDDVDQYLVFSNSHDGSSRVKMVVTPIRVVCNNTLSMALKTHSHMWSAVHTGNLDNKITDAIESLGFANEYYQELGKAAEGLYKIKMSDKEFEKLLDHYYPLTDEMSSRKRNVYEYNRDALKRAYGVDDLQEFRGTAWGVINAVSDFATHTPARGKGLDQEYVLWSVINKEGLIQQVYEMMMEKV